MKKVIDFDCPCCGKRHRLSRIIVDTIIWADGSLLRTRAYGNELLHIGIIAFTCPASKQSFNAELRVIEYPESCARIQQVLICGQNVTDELKIRYQLGLERLKSGVFPSGSSMVFRHIEKYETLDKMVNERAKTMLINSLNALGVHYAEEPEICEDVDRNLHDLLPASFSLCKNEENGVMKYGKSQRMPSTLSSDLKRQLVSLGAVIGQKSRSVKSDCPYTLGNCSEFNAANNVLLRRKANSFDSLVFSIAVRPRTMQIIEPCMNCATVFPTL